MRKLVYGVALNDADYAVKPVVNGKQLPCPFYQAWKDMLRRCYDTNFQAKKPTYARCSVADEWLVFSNFKRWMEMQDWIGKHLDKDILVKGNKVYSPNTCVFIDEATNNFTTDRAADRGEFPIGVSFRKDNGKFQALCRNQFTKKLEHLGFFTCTEQAHQAWKKRKHELACQLADIQTDGRVAAALRLRYAP